MRPTNNFEEITEDEFDRRERAKAEYRRALQQQITLKRSSCDGSALAAAFGAEGVITALHWRPKIVHIGVVAVGETTIYQLKGSDEHLRFGPRSLYGQAETASGQQQAGRPG